MNIWIFVFNFEYLSSVIWNIFLHLIVSASHQALAINLLYVVAHLVSQKVDHPKTFDEINLNVWDAVDDAALLDPLDESVARPVVRDRQT